MNQSKGKRDGHWEAKQPKPGSKPHTCNSTLRRQKQENHEFKVSMVCLKSQTEQQKGHISECILNSTSDQDPVSDSSSKAPLQQETRRRKAKASCVQGAHSSCFVLKPHLSERIYWSKLQEAGTPSDRSSNSKDRQRRQLVLSAALA